MATWRFGGFSGSASWWFSGPATWRFSDSAIRWFGDLAVRWFSDSAMSRHCAGAAWLGGDRRGDTVKLGRDRRATVKNWWSQAGSNRRPQHCQCCALPTELWPPSNSREYTHPTAGIQGLYGFNSLTHHARPLPRHTRSPRLKHCGGDVLSGRTHCHSGDSRSPESLSTVPARSCPRGGDGRRAGDGRKIPGPSFRAVEE